METPQGEGKLLTTGGHCPANAPRVDSSESVPVEKQSLQRLNVVEAEGKHGNGAVRFQQEQSDTPQHTPEIRVTIHNESWWKSFMEIGNEMVVSKPGRLVETLQGIKLT